jgi:hypothetical protein
VAFGIASDCGYNVVANRTMRTAFQAWTRKRTEWVWVFKINTKRGWEFDEYFRSRARGPYEMGDEGWIRSASSLRYLREEVKRGDIFLCYEVDRKQVVGVARAASDGRDVGMGSLIDFCSPREAVRLQNPLTRRPDLEHILAFSPQRGRGTVQKIDSDEFARLRRAILHRNPQQAEALRRLLGCGARRQAERGLETASVNLK